MNSSEKLSILVVGKSKKHRCFQGVKSLPCDMKATSGYVDDNCNLCSLFEKDKDKMKKAKRNIIFVDNCAANSKDTKNLSNIKVHFLPPNLT